MTSLRVSNRPKVYRRSPKSRGEAPKINPEEWRGKLEPLSPWSDLEAVKTEHEYPSIPLTEIESVYSAEKEFTHMVQQLHSIFMKAGNMAKVSGNALTVEESMVFADNYHDLIRQTMNDLADRTDVSPHVGDAMVVGDIVWGLIEGLLIRPQNRSVVADLIEWAQSTFPQASKYFNEVQSLAATTLRVEDDPIYWHSVLAQISVGQTKSAAAVLQMSSNYRNNINMQRMVTLLAAFNVNALHSSDEAGDSFRAAQRQVHDNLHHFVDDEALVLMCRLLIGDTDAFKKLSTVLDRPWYELMPGYILYTNATASMNDLYELVHDLFKLIGTAESQFSIDLLNEVIFLLSRTEWIQAIKHVSSVPSLVWLSVHLFDLLIKTEVSFLTEEVEVIHDDIFGAYSRLLFRNFNDFSSVEAAVTYGQAAYNPERSEFVDPWLTITVNNYLQQKDVTSAENCFNLAQCHGFIDSPNKISQGISHFFLLQRDWARAITWAMRNENLDIINSVCYFILSNAPPGELKDMHVFKDQPPTNESEALVFLHNFHLFHASLEPLDVAKCTQLLHNLIINQLAPPAFMHVLFDNLARVIDATNKVLERQPLLNVKAVESLQHCVVLYQAQSEVRAECFQHIDEAIHKYNPRMAHLHAVLSTALAQALLWYRAPRHH
uniref:Nuclear pore complex protein Nup85 n=1 Tax=Panagrellus redivivus TaxID=6233 RepID=A0A7E4W2M9_PANRE